MLLVRRRFAALAAALAIGALVALPLAVAGLELPPSREGVYVYDLANIWSANTEAAAQQIATEIRDRTQAQLAIVSWPTGLSHVDTDTARVDARTIMRTWGVGRLGVDDGLVVLFDMDTSLEHGQVFLWGGDGYLRDYLNEDEAKSVVDDDMLPKAKDGDLDGALLAGLARVDHVTQPGGNPDRTTQRILQALLVALVIGGAGLIFVLFLRTWWMRGRDAVIPLVDDSVLLPAPPPGLTPALATALDHDRVDREAFTSALVDLGHRGLVTFMESPSDKKHVDLLVPDEPLIDPGSLEARRRPLGDAEDRLARRIASKTDSNGVLSWSKLKAGEGAKLYESFKKSLGESAKASGWFRDDPNRLPARWVGIGVGLLIAVALFFFFFAADKSDDSQLIKPGAGYLVLPILIAIGFAIAIIAMSRLLAARTESGARTLAMARAYRNTLRFEMQASKTVDEAVAKTQQRLPWITTPDLLTVWAVALGLKDDVDKLIKETFETAQRTGTAVWSPAWYTGSGGVSSMSSLSGMVGSIGTTAASSSGSGYGGGGGGGGGGAGGGF
jgi:uncharacterized membrane protein YgcG